MLCLPAVSRQMSMGGQPGDIHPDWGVERIERTRCDHDLGHSRVPGSSRLRVRVRGLGRPRNPNSHRFLDEERIHVGMRGTPSPQNRCTRPVALLLVRIGLAAPGRPIGAPGARVFGSNNLDISRRIVSHCCWHPRRLLLESSLPSVAIVTVETRGRPRKGRIG